MATLRKLLLDCAGIDIGSEKIFISVEGQPVRSFGSFTDDYLAAIAYLKEHGITSVAMEATSVYWIPLFEMLEAAGITVCLVNNVISQIHGVSGMRVLKAIVEGEQNERGPRRSV